MQVTLSVVVTKEIPNTLVLPKQAFSNLTFTKVVFLPSLLDCMPVIWNGGGERWSGGGESGRINATGLKQVSFAFYNI